MKKIGERRSYVIGDKTKGIIALGLDETFDEPRAFFDI